MRESRKRSADDGRRGRRRRGGRAPLVEEVVDAPETEFAEVWWSCFAEEETVLVEDVEGQLVARWAVVHTRTRDYMARMRRCGGSRNDGAGRESTS